MHRALEELLHYLLTRALPPTLQGHSVRVPGTLALKKTLHGAVPIIVLCLAHYSGAHRHVTAPIQPWTVK
jgi:hypothetical protein